MAINCCCGSDLKLSNKKNVFGVDLINVDRIIIETNKKVPSLGYEKRTIKNKNNIDFVVDELKNLSEPVGIDIMCTYIVSFFESNKLLLKLKLYMNAEISGSSFIRYSTETLSNDYYIDRKLHDFFINTLIFGDQEKING